MSQEAEVQQGRLCGEVPCPRKPSLPDAKAWPQLAAGQAVGGLRRRSAGYERPCVLECARPLALREQSDRFVVRSGMPPVARQNRARGFVRRRLASQLADFVDATAINGERAASALARLPRTEPRDRRSPASIRTELDAEGRADQRPPGRPGFARPSVPKPSRPVGRAAGQPAAVGAEREIAGAPLMPHGSRSRSGRVGASARASRRTYRTGAI